MKEGIQQTIKNAEIREYGCYFLDILKWAEMDTGKDFDEIHINAVYQEAKRLGFLGADCFVVNAPEIYRLASGERRYSAMTKITGVPDKETYIICLKKPMYTHFVLWHKGVVWDSLDPRRPAAASYKPDSYRTFV